MLAALLLETLIVPIIMGVLSVLICTAGRAVVFGEVKLVPLWSICKYVCGTNVPVGVATVLVVGSSAAVNVIWKSLESMRRHRAPAICPGND